jgi:hypothetical protein
LGEGGGQGSHERWARLMGQLGQKWLRNLGNDFELFEWKLSWVLSGFGQKRFTNILRYSYAFSLGLKIK